MSSPIHDKQAADALVFTLKSDFLKQLAHPARLRIIEYLKHGEQPAGRIVNALGIEQSSLSRHLAALRALGILSARQEKSRIFYRIQDEDIFLVLRPIAQILRKRLRHSERLLAVLGVDRTRHA